MFSTEPSGVPEGDTAAESGRPSLPVMPPWRLYGFTVASFGLYVPYWVYRLSRAHGCTRRSTRAAWALGSLIPPVGAALLYEFNGPPREASPYDELPGDEPPSDESLDPTPATVEDSRRGASPAILLLVLLAVCSFTSLRHFTLAPLFLLPIPVAWVQRTINRMASSPAPAVSVRWWAWAAGSIGTLLVAAAVWHEAPGFLRQLRRIEADAVVVAGSDVFAVIVPTQHWRQVEPGTIGDSDSELELTGPGAETWAVAYSRPRSETHLDNVIAERRSMIFDSGKPLDFRESRRFLDGSDFVPVSTTDYEIDFGLGSVGFYVVLTAETEDEVIELITYTAEPKTYLDEIRRLAQSFVLRPASDVAGEEL